MLEAAGLLIAAFVLAVVFRWRRRRRGALAVRRAQELEHSLGIQGHECDARCSLDVLPDCGAHSWEQVSSSNVQTGEMQAYLRCRSCRARQWTALP